MKKQLFGLGLALYSALGVSQEICTPISVGKDIKSKYESEIYQTTVLPNKNSLFK